MGANSVAAAEVRCTVGEGRFEWAGSECGGGAGGEGRKTGSEARGSMGIGVQRGPREILPWPGPTSGTPRVPVLPGRQWSWVQGVTRQPGQPLGPPLPPSPHAMTASPRTLVSLPWKQAGMWKSLSECWAGWGTWEWELDSVHKHPGAGRLGAGVIGTHQNWTGNLARPGFPAGL